MIKIMLIFALITASLDKYAQDVFIIFQIGFLFGPAIFI